MLATHVKKVLSEIENDRSIVFRQQVYRSLRHLGLEDFGYILWNMPIAEYPKVSSLLPPMASPEVTIGMTGAAGMDLLSASVAFARSCSENYSAITGGTLKGKRILDFGCGYGRFLRLISYYTDDIFGVDAWQQSLDYSRDAGLGELVALSEEVPSILPYDGLFDFAIAFSVFTHISEASTCASLLALRRKAKVGSVLCITFRPIDIWDMAKQTSLVGRDAEADACKEIHALNGFAFLPYPTSTHYGETTLEIEWLERKLVGWRIAAIDRSLSDPFQRYAFLEAI